MNKYSIILSCLLAFVLALPAKNYIHFDAKQGGVGTATCGPGVLPHYRVKPLPTYFDFQFTVKSVK